MNKKKRTPVIAGNWKMNFTPDEAAEFIGRVAPIVANVENCEIKCMAPYISIPAAIKAAESTNVEVGAENVHFAPRGAYTGEISAEMLKAIGVRTTLVGHSERRQYFGETDKTVNLRAKAALAEGLSVIICLGEVKEQRLTGITNEVIGIQTKLSLAEIDEEQLDNVIIAYEPVWAIGTGLTATPEEADEACAAIRGVIADMYGENAAEKMRILYGGSMNEKNAAELLSKPDVDGGLIGGASLVPEKFTAIIAATQQ